MNSQENKSSGRKSGLAAFFKRRQFRYGGVATLLIVVVIAVIILLNVAVGAIENNWALTIDLSSSGITSFSDATYETLDALNQEVHIYTVYQPGAQSELRIQVDEVLAKYRARNRNVVLGNIDPVTEPLKVTQYAGSDTSVSEGAIIVTNADETRVKVITADQYNTYQQNSYTGAYYTIFSAESLLTSALLYVTSESTPAVYFLTGHNEVPSSYCTLIAGQLELNNYDVSDLDLSTNSVELKKGDTIVVLNPSRDLLADEYETLQSWLTSGGRLLMAMDYSVDMTALVNFNKLLDYYNVGFDVGYVSEDESQTGNWRQAPYYLVPNLDAEHEVTTALTTENPSTFLILPYARPLKSVDFPESGIQYGTLLTSSALSTVITDAGTSVPGSRTVAMTVLDQDYEDPTNDVRIALLGSIVTIYGTSSYDNSFLAASYDGEFTLELIDWLANQNVSVSVSSKLAADSVLSIPDQASLTMLMVIVIGVIPIIVLAAGILVWARRRRL